MNSCLYFGEVFHARYSPTLHSFRQNLFMAHLYLDELDKVFLCHPLWSSRNRNVACFDRKDYHGDPNIPLEDSLRQTCRDQLGYAPGGRISMLAHLRYFGHCFNPVTFYYFWEENLSQPQAILAEINNTPWNERYARAFPWACDSRGKAVMKFIKEFHVSPFMQMEMHYTWEFGTPGEVLQVHMVNDGESGKTFEASMNLKRKPINFPNLSFALLRFPAITLQILLSIYWHALLLKWKGCQFYPHPKSQTKCQHT